MLILFVSIGSFTERGTEVRAARCRTHSASCIAFRTTSISVMLPLMRVILLRNSARFSSLPEERSSSTTTLWPRRTSSSYGFEPMRPAPPATRERTQQILLALAPAIRPWIVSAHGNLPPLHGTASQPQPTVPRFHTAAPRVDTWLTLKASEVLEYSSNVSKLDDVATLQMQVAGRRNFLGKSTWHLQAFAHTRKPLRMVFELEDRFDSCSDAATLASLP